jgi:hypothetical protein
MTKPTDQVMSALERAAVMTGRVDYFDAAGVQLRGVDVTNDYYSANRGETFPAWVTDRVAANTLQITVWPPDRESML